MTTPATPAAGDGLPNVTRRHLLKAAPAAVLVAGIAAPAAAEDTPIARLFAEWRALLANYPAGAGEAEANEYHKGISRVEEAIALEPSLGARDLAIKVFVWRGLHDTTMDPDGAGPSVVMTGPTLAELRQLVEVSL